MFSLFRFFLAMIVSFTVVHAFVISNNKRKNSWQGPSIERGIRSGISAFELKSSLSSETSPPLHSEVVAAGNSYAFLDFDGEAVSRITCVRKISSEAMTTFMQMTSIITFLTACLSERLEFLSRRHFYNYHVH